MSFEIEILFVLIILLRYLSKNKLTIYCHTILQKSHNTAVLHDNNKKWMAIIKTFTIILLKIKTLDSCKDHHTRINKNNLINKFIISNVYLYYKWLTF